MISTADDEIATGLIKQQFQLEELRLNALGLSLAGRVKVRMIVQQFIIPTEISQDQAVRAISTTLLQGGLQGVRSFLAAWDEVVLVGGAAITEHQLRTNFYAQICKVDEFKFDAMLHERLPPAHPNRTYSALRTAVDSVVEKKKAGRYRTRSSTWPTNFAGCCCLSSQ